jgi:hypothetical protein
MRHSQILLLLFFAVNTTYGQETKSLNKNRFIQDYVSARNKIERAFSSYEVKTMMETIRADEKIQVMESSHRLQSQFYYTEGTSGVLEKDRSKYYREPGWSGYVGNSKYSFYLKKDNDKYKLTKLILNSDGIRPLDSLSLFYALWDIGLPYLKLSESNDFDFELYDDILYKDRPAKKLVLFRKESDKLSKRYTAIFLPDLAWSCTSLTIWSSELPDLEMEDIVEFEEKSSDLPIPVRYERVVRNKSVPKVQFSGKITEFRRVPQVEESEFSLSHFGIPEPEGITFKKPSSNLYLYLAIVAIVLLIFSTLARFYFRISKTST